MKAKMQIDVEADPFELLAALTRCEWAWSGRWTAEEADAVAELEDAMRMYSVNGRHHESKRRAQIETAFALDPMSLVKAMWTVADEDGDSENQDPVVRKRVAKKLRALADKLERLSR